MAGGEEAQQDEDSVEFAEIPSEEEVELAGHDRFREAVLHGTDWTTETIVSQLRRGNILMNPAFQRRDAWKKPQKSRFIESLIVGLPIPQIVLAEVKDRRGKFIVLDGKQRLLSILQFWGLGDGLKNAYALSGLDIRKDLARKKLSHFESDPELEDDLNALLNQPIRTVVIKNWPDSDFLHVVFLRLNTGSVKLSPQELRQALYPGPFTDWVDEAAVKSAGIQSLLKLKEPDYRMRDIEVLSRHLAFRFRLSEYQGRMKKFLDSTFEAFNADWATWKPKLVSALADFEAGVTALEQIFGPKVGRKPNSRLFNRAAFDFLAFYAQDSEVRESMIEKRQEVVQAFDELFDNADFKEAIERDTAGVPNTVLRMATWGETLGTVLGMTIPVPAAVEDEVGKRISFSGF